MEMYNIFHACKVAAEKCGGTVYVPIDSLESYRFQSPNYPGNYSNNLFCEWNFVLRFPVPQAYKGSALLDEKSLRLVFEEPIFIEKTNNCLYDYIEVLQHSITHRKL